MRSISRTHAIPNPAWSSPASRSITAAGGETLGRPPERVAPSTSGAAERPFPGARQRCTANAHVSPETGRHAVDESMRRHIGQNDRAHTDHRIGVDLDPGTDKRPGPDGGAAADVGAEGVGCGLGGGEAYAAVVEGARIAIVREDDTSRDHHAVLDRDPGADVDVCVDLHVVPDCHTVGDVGLLADDAVLADR